MTTGGNGPPERPPAYMEPEKSRPQPKKAAFHPAWDQDFELFGHDAENMVPWDSESDSTSGTGSSSSGLPAELYEGWPSLAGNPARACESRGNIPSTIPEHGRIGMFDREFSFVQELGSDSMRPQAPSPTAAPSRTASNPSTAGLGNSQPSTASTVWNATPIPWTGIAEPAERLGGALRRPVEGGRPAHAEFLGRPDGHAESANTEGARPTGAEGVPRPDSRVDSANTDGQAESEQPRTKLSL